MADGGIDGPAGLALWERADRVLPGGGIYLTRSADLAGRGTLPGFIAAAEGCRVTDVDGRTYIDLLCANGPNLLGYRHPEVEEAAARQAAAATSASLLPPALVDVVEQLVERFPPMAWGVVGKNGSEVVSLAARVARHHTGRRALVAFRSAYHGNDPELALLPGPGPLAEVVDHVHRVPWNDPDALVDLARRHGDDLAVVLVNPLDQNPGQRTIDLSADQVAAIHEVRDRHGVVVVLDDVRHGFRLHPQGSHRASGLDPDLVCLGKALGNGHAISAVLGRDELRGAARQILFTSTYMFEAPPMAAAMATVEVYDRDSVFDHLVAVGEQLRRGLLAAAATAGHRVTVTGPPAMPTLLVDDDPGAQRGRAFARAAAERERSCTPCSTGSCRRPTRPPTSTRWSTSPPPPSPPPHPAPVEVTSDGAPRTSRCDVDAALLAEVTSEGAPRAVRCDLDARGWARPEGGPWPDVRAPRAAWDYSMRRPEMARAMTSSWICSVPSKMS